MRQRMAFAKPAWVVAGWLCALLVCCGEAAGKPVIGQTGIAENFRIVNYRRRGYAGSSRAPAGMTMQGWAGDCIALLNHLGIASAHVAGHSFGAGIALQMAIDAPGRVRKLALLEPPLLSLVPSGGQFTEWVAS